MLLGLRRAVGASKDGVYREFLSPSSLFQAQSLLFECFTVFRNILLTFQACYAKSAPDLHANLPPKSHHLTGQMSPYGSQSLNAKLGHCPPFRVFILVYIHSM